jgi:hypothetical protein
MFEKCCFRSTLPDGNICFGWHKIHVFLLYIRRVTLQGVKIRSLQFFFFFVVIIDGLINEEEVEGYG